MSKNANPKNRTWYLRLKSSSWITIIGGITIFSSWIVEKRFQSQWSADKNTIKQFHLLSETMEGRMATYEVAYMNEVQRPYKDSLLLAKYQQRLVIVYYDLLSSCRGLVSDEDKVLEEFLSLKYQIEKLIDTKIIEGDYKSVLRNFNLVKEGFGAFYRQLDIEISNGVDEIHKKEKFWSLIFTILYILGSLLLGISYLTEQLKYIENEKR